MKHQLDEEEKRRLSDRVITNDEHEMLLPQIIAVHQEIMEQVRNDKSSPEITKLKN
jgi:dephospho-CoA kinase